MDTKTQSSLGEVIRLFLRLGFTAFGGPAAHIAMMHDEVVVRRGWMEEQHFLDLVGATNLIPGPNSTEMAIHIGYDRAGWRGLVAAGVCFILPAALIVGILAWAYLEYGRTPQGEALLYGIKPVIIAIVLQALVRLGRTAVKGPLLALIGVAALLLYLFGVNELLLLFGGGLVLVALQAIRQAPKWGGIFLPLIGVSGLVRLVEPSPVRLDQLFFIFLKVGAVLYGSGYVLLAFLRNDFVLRLGWLTDQQLEPIRKPGLLGLKCSSRP
jgi:chromate transporter